MQKRTKILLTLIVVLVIVAGLFIVRAYLFDLFGISADVAQNEKKLKEKIVSSGDFENDTFKNTEIKGDAIRLKKGESNQACGNAPEDDPDLTPNSGEMAITITDGYPDSKQERIFGYYVGKDAKFYASTSEITLAQTDSGVAESAPGLKVERGTGWVYFELDKANISKVPGVTKRVKGEIVFSDLDLKASSIKNVSAEKINDGIEAAAGNNDEISVDAQANKINFFLATTSSDTDGFYVNYCYWEEDSYKAKGYVEGVVDLQKSNSISKLIVSDVDVNKDSTKMHIIASLSGDGENWTRDYKADNSNSLIFNEELFQNKFCYRYVKYRIRLVSSNIKIQPGLKSLQVFGGGVCKDQPENPTRECNDGVDNDNDGKIDFGKDAGCYSSMDNTEVNSEKICKDGTHRNIKFKVNFGKIENQGEGDLKKRVYVGENSNYYDNNEWINLVVDGVAVKDNSLNQDVPGMAVSRGDGYLLVSFYGGNTKKDKETVKGKITFSNSYALEAINGYEGAEEGKNTDGFENQGNGKHDQIANDDEFWMGENDDNKPKVVEFASTVDFNADTFYIYYDYKSKIGGNCQCQDNKDNDKDTLIDYPEDPGCGAPTDDDERNSAPNVVYPECSDGIDNDGDGFIDCPDDKGCNSLMDDQEIDAKTVCLSTFNGEEVKLKADFEVVENAGDGNMKKRVYIGNKEGFYKEGEWIPLVERGVAIQDAEPDRDKPGLVLQRGEGYFFVSLYGFSNDKAGREIVSAKITLDNGYIVKTINGRKKEDGQDDHDGPFDNQGDGIYKLGVATQDEYIEGLSITENPGPSDIELYATTSSGADSFYVYYDYLPIKGGGCQCQDAIDNDGDELIDYPKDPGCDSREDDDEKNDLSDVIADPENILPSVIKSGVAFWVLVALTLLIGGFVIYRIARNEDEIPENFENQP